MFDVFVHGRLDEVEESFEEGGDQGVGRIADVVYYDDAFCLFEDLENVN